jgi:hypothetical protein
MSCMRSTERLSSLPAPDLGQHQRLSLMILLLANLLPHAYLTAARGQGGQGGTGPYRDRRGASLHLLPCPCMTPPPLTRPASCAPGRFVDAWCGVVLCRRGWSCQPWSSSTWTSGPPPSSWRSTRTSCRTTARWSSTCPMGLPSPSRSGSQPLGCCGVFRVFPAVIG